MKHKYVHIRVYNSDTGKFSIVAKKFMTERQLLDETSKPTVCDVMIRGNRSMVNLANRATPDVIVYHK